MYSFVNSPVRCLVTNVVFPTAPSPTKINFHFGICVCFEVGWLLNPKFENIEKREFTIEPEEKAEEDDVEAEEDKVEAEVEDIGFSDDDFGVLYSGDSYSR
jgi:hypothetical protein